MDMNDFKRFVEKVHGSAAAAKLTPGKIQDTWKRNWAPVKNRLLKEGFYRLMTTTARNDEEQVWRDLHSLGFMDTGLRFGPFQSRVCLNDEV